MSAILQTCRRAAAGRIACIADSAPDHYHNGLPFNAEGRLCITTQSPTYFHQGLVFAANGQLSVAADDAAAVYYGSGGAGYVAGELARRRIDPTIVSYVHGIPYGGEGRVSTVNGAPVIVEPFPPDANMVAGDGIGNRIGYQKGIAGSYTTDEQSIAEVTQVYTRPGSGGQLYLYAINEQTGLPMPESSLFSFRIDNVGLFLAANAMFEGDRWRWNNVGFQFQEGFSYDLRFISNVP